VTDLVVWTGPVAPFQVPGATVVGAQELFVSCCGDLTPPCKPPTCPDIGAAVMGNPDALLSRAGLTSSDIDELYLGAFSAGGSILKRVLENPAYRDLATAVLLSDATYTTGWIGNPAERNPPPIEGFVQYAVEVASGPGDKLFVATASPMPNSNWSTGVETLGAVRREVEVRTGRTFDPIDSFFDVDPQPERAYKLGNVIFAEYSVEPLGHGHTKIAPQVWQKILQPWLDKGKGAVESPGGIIDPNIPPQPQPLPTDEGIGVGGVLLGLLGAGVGYLVVSKLMRRRK
jgi:hypothetical protein